MSRASIIGLMVSLFMGAMACSPAQKVQEIRFELPTISVPLPTIVIGGEAPAAPAPSDVPPARTIAPTVVAVDAAPNGSGPQGILAELVVAPISSNFPKYDRKDWRHWVDSDKDCQDTRQEVLVAEAVEAVKFTDERECRVASGRWVAPYSNSTVDHPRRLDVDHMVPLANAHRSGAHSWTPERKREYANYLQEQAHLIAVTAGANRSKGARGPEEWRPPETDYWCQYATDWASIKVKWQLTVTPEELAALKEMLATCPGDGP